MLAATPASPPTPAVDGCKNCKRLLELIQELIPVSRVIDGEISQCLLNEIERIDFEVNGAE